MNKRVLCLLTALLLVLPSAASPSAACDHFRPDGIRYDTYLDGYVEPQAGVPGYSGDFRCSNCGEIVYPGYELYAEDYYNCINPPADKPDPRIPDTSAQSGGSSEADPGDSDQPSDPATPAETDPQDPPAASDDPDLPVTPETPAQSEPRDLQADSDDPENPANSESPLPANSQEQPDKPETPEQPVNSDGTNPPDQPAEQEEPLTSAAPAHQKSEEAAEPEVPVQPASPALQDQPDNPALPEVPVLAADSVRSDVSDESVSPEQAVIPPREDLPADQDIPAEITSSLPVVPEDSNPEEPAASSPGSLSGTGSRTGKQEPFSEKYPYRRVKMTPQKGIRAKAAGILIWPSVQTPFQQMLQ